MNTMTLMQGAQRLATTVAVVAVMVVGGDASAQKRKAPVKKKPVKALVGAKLVQTVTPGRGFVDSPFAFDGAGGRVVYVEADAGGAATLKVLDLAQDGAALASVDITSSITLPSDVEFALDGAHYFVVGKKTIDAPTTAIIVNDKGKVVRSFGPADDIRMTTYGGDKVVVTHSVREVENKKGPSLTRHTVEVVNAATGKRVGKTATLDADETGYIKTLDFRISYWTNDFTRLVGIKGGEWDKKENQRSPNTEGWFDVPVGVFSRRLPIKNVMEHTHQMALMAEHPHQSVFATVATDLSGVLVYRDGESTPLTLALPFHHYLHTSLEYQGDEWGNLFFTMTVDSVNADAVSRKKADIAYLDLYMVAAGTSNAVRLARLRADKRKYLWRATAENWLVVQRHVGFERGGKALSIYRFEK